MEGYARAIGLDVAKWNDCVDSQRHQREIEASRDEAIKRGVSQTPSFIIAGKMYLGGLPYDEINKIVTAAALAAPASATPASAAPASTATDSASRKPVPAAIAPGKARTR